MKSKWIALGGTMAVSLCFLGGMSLAQEDEDSPLHKVMEKVQKHNATILRGVRNKAGYAKSQADVATAATELVKMAKEARPLGKEVAEAQKKEVAEWEKLTDSWITESEKFQKLVADTATEQPAAKESYKMVSGTCTKCHDEFRVDDSGF